MNLVGKIFVFLIFCMSAVFGSFAVVLYATHVTWREKAIALSADIDAAKKRNADLVNAKAELNKQRAEDQAQHRQREGALEAEKEVLRAENQKWADMYNGLDTKFKTDLTNLGTAQQTLASKSNEVVSLRDAIRKAHERGDKGFNELLNLTELLQATEGNARRLKDRNEELVAAVAKYKIALDKVHPNYNVDNPPSPDTGPVKGHVTGVLRNAENTYVQLSIGSDDGLQLDNSLEVFRGDTYVGRITIIRTTPNKSVGRIIGRPKAEPMQGDRVESRASLKLTGS